MLVMKQFESSYQCIISTAAFTYRDHYSTLRLGVADSFIYDMELNTSLTKNGISIINLIRKQVNNDD